MLSYQHGYHAGNGADVHKHTILAGLLRTLTRKPRSISVFETHAGRGLDQVDSTQARKTGEAAFGINRLMPGLSPPQAGDPYLDAVAHLRSQLGPRAYPGSPYITQANLRDGDSHILFERHPAEHRALCDAMDGSDASIHFGDGYEGVLALAPPTPRRGLVLVDPSYEVKSEYAEAARFAHRLAARWPEAVIMIWYPLLDTPRHAPLLEGLALPRLVHEVEVPQKPGHGMRGSGMVLLNPPHTARAVLDVAEALVARLFA